MQSDRAEKKAEEWAGKECRHPDYEKEYILGAHTGDYVCSKCGKVFQSREAAQEAKDLAERE